MSCYAYIWVVNVVHLVIINHYYYTPAQEWEVIAHADEGTQPPRQKPGCQELPVHETRVPGPHRKSYLTHTGEHQVTK